MTGRQARKAKLAKQAESMLSKGYVQIRRTWVKGHSTRARKYFRS